jgi:hypothetical protein
MRNITVPLLTQVKLSCHIKIILQCAAGDVVLRFRIPCRYALSSDLCQNDFVDIDLLGRTDSSSERNLEPKNG